MKYKVYYKYYLEGIATVEANNKKEAKREYPCAEDYGETENVIQGSAKVIKIVKVK